MAAEPGGDAAFCVWRSISVEEAALSIARVLTKSVYSGYLIKGR